MLSTTFPIQNSGIQKGDIIYKINGTQIDYPIAITKYFNMSKEFDGFTAETVANFLIFANKDFGKVAEAANTACSN